MINQHVSSINHDLEFVQSKTFDSSEYLNLPDLQFFHSCQHQFKINKGVYNTIDNWFFQKGIVSVLNRRIYILAFLDFVKETMQYNNQNKYLRFGNGGLTNTLQQFLKSIDRLE